MTAFIIRRLFVSLLVILGSLTLVFFILHILPGDPATIMASTNTATPEMLENLKQQFGLDQPIPLQYWNYMTELLRGDLGHSLTNGEPVGRKLLAQFPSTLVLTLLSIVAVVISGILLGIIAAIFENRWPDYVIRALSITGISMPTFWSAILLILVFSVELNWFPAIGNGGIEHLVLPVCALSLVGSGFLARMVRNSVLEVLHEPFVLTLRAKGLPEKMVIGKHVLRNALIPAVTMVGLLTGELLAGAVVIETIFARQGIGRVIVDAIMTKDLPVIRGSILLTSIIYVVVNLLVDISYSIIDPRIRQKS
ncbi:ABC transporter permease [Cohnella abietis]|uniref:Peptide ABC transporter permease n=1 Tax=Cohnella abietis TaxID=2507935 RepID=A0A3T1CZD3_9BACL|nr:ABC transporter permease [Cohnella abietis]BBI31129.1 peptide ABC transporter permease [Cohnella abietis]